MFELRDVEFVQESNEPFCISYCPNEKNNNTNGTVHGGVIFLICDEIVGRYFNNMSRKGAAADANIHYYRPAMANEKIYATLKERKVGKKLGSYLVEVTNEKNKLVAEAMFTIAFLDN